MPDIQAQTPDGVTHSFPDGTPDEVVDKVVRNHIQNVMPYTEKGAAAAPPIEGVTHNTPQRGISGTVKGGQNPLGIRIGMDEAEEPSNKAIGEATGVIGAAAPALVSPVTTAGALVGGAVGAPLGKSGFRRVADAFGASPQTQDTVGTVGGYTGGLLGSIAGGGAVENFEGLPEDTSLFGMKFKTPNFLRKSPFTPSEGYSNPLGPDAGEFEAQHEAQLTKEGKLAKIPVRVPKPAPTPEDIAKRGMAVGQAKSTLVHGRPFEELNEQEQAEALMRRGKEQQQIDEGAPVEGSSQKPVTVPEPNPTGPGEKPGAQWSVKRRTDLIQNAKRGKEGAGTVLNQINKPVLYEPRGVVGTNPRTPEVDSAIRGGGTIGSGPVGNSPQESPGLSDPTNPMDRRGVPRPTAFNSASPDPIREARLDSLRKIVRDPTAPARDRGIAQSQLEDMESNPGERNTLGDNPTQLKKPQPTMTREEAEEASRKRTEGRNARFGGTK